MDDRGASNKQARARLQVGGKARGGAHREHVVHVRDAGCVEDQRLVERRRVLPRDKTRAYGAGDVRTGRREVAGDSDAKGPQGRARGCRLGAGQHRREERTRNMPCMFVTLEVLQPEMSALK